MATAPAAKAMMGLPMVLCGCHKPWCHENHCEESAAACRCRPEKTFGADSDEWGLKPGASRWPKTFCRFQV
jgi:hypothetical protein